MKMSFNLILEVYMYKKILLFILFVAMLSMTAACGGGDAPAPADEAQPVEETAPLDAEEPVQEEAEAPSNATVETEFPLPDDVDAGSIQDLGDGAINFQTTLSLPDAVAFYRAAFADLGYIERDILTGIEDAAFSMVFDGHLNGKAIVIQGVDLGESLNINLRFEDV